MRSMTGFGQAAGESERFRITVTLRGVNHRFLDLSIRLREALRGREPTLRDLLSARLWRGRVEVSLDVLTLGARDPEVTIDEEMAVAVRGVCDGLRQRGVVAGELEISDLLRLPDIVKLQSHDPEWADDDQAVLRRVTGEALDQLIDARILEGEKLAAALNERLDGLEQLAAELVARGAQAVKELAGSLRQRISELTDSAIDEDRLAQEVALLVDRSDVSEELDRLTSHLEHFRTVMSQDGSIGKRLDFLTQEIFRELNTLGAKCRDSEMIRRVLDSKVLCEQLREQVQNIE
ncbi:MAG: YicC/YloC family endoribonuclease [Acidobacteriota bacterium]